ncbi:2629_t:CDS:2, partial [Funneliformis geosporum]
SRQGFYVVNKLCPYVIRVGYQKSVIVREKSTVLIKNIFQAISKPEIGADHDVLESHPPSYEDVMMEDARRDRESSVDAASMREEIELLEEILGIFDEEEDEE